MPYMIVDTKLSSHVYDARHYSNSFVVMCHLVLLTIMFFLPSIALSHAPPFIRLHFFEVFDQQSPSLTSVLYVHEAALACTHSYLDTALLMHPAFPLDLSS